MDIYIYIICTKNNSTVKLESLPRKFCKSVFYFKDLSIIFKSSFFNYLTWAILYMQRHILIGFYSFSLVIIIVLLVFEGLALSQITNETVNLQRYFERSESRFVYDLTKW